MQRDLRQAQASPTLSDSLTQRTQRSSPKNSHNATSATGDEHDRSQRDNAKTTHERQANDLARGQGNESRNARVQRARERDHDAATRDESAQRVESESSIAASEDESRVHRDDSLNETSAQTATSSAPVEVVTQDEDRSTSAGGASLDDDGVSSLVMNAVQPSSINATAASISAQALSQGAALAASVAIDSPSAAEHVSGLPSVDAASSFTTGNIATQTADSASVLAEAANAIPTAATAIDATSNELAASDARSSVEGASNGRHRDAGNTRATGEQSSSAAATNNAVRAASDPLARLIESAQFSLRESTLSAPSSAAVSGRLAQVESEISRMRAAQQIASGAVSIDASDESASGSGATSPVLSSAALNAQAGSTNAHTNAAGISMPLIATVEGATSATSTLPAEVPSSNPFENPAAAKLAAKGAEILANQRGGTITMRLEPPALGQLRIELRISQGAVVADFTAATPEARALLEANLGMLRERLESQGLSVERISVHGGTRGTEATSAPLGQSGHESRQDGADNRDRGERASTRQDAAGGESRGRRDDAQDGRKRTDALAVDEANERKGALRGFAGVLHGVADPRGANSSRRAS